MRGSPAVVLVSSDASISSALYVHGLTRDPRARRKCQEHVVESSRMTDCRLEGLEFEGVDGFTCQRLETGIIAREIALACS